MENELQIVGYHSLHCNWITADLVDVSSGWISDLNNQYLSMANTILNPSLVVISNSQIERVERVYRKRE